MNDLEHELRRALARKEPREGFADAAVQRLPRRRAALPARWLAVAAVLVLMLASLLEHQRRRRIEEQEAGRELVRAMEIVNTQLSNARQRVIELGDSTWELEKRSLRP
jgi:hypothetical protein